MRKLLVILWIAVVLIFSCQQPINQNSVAGTLPNGATITSVEKAKLDVLKPQVDGIIAEVFGDKTEQSSGKQIIMDQNALLDKVQTLLKGQFGDNYGKFIIKKEHPLVSVQNSDKSSSNIVADTSSISAVSKSISGSVNNVKIGYKQTSTSSWKSISIDTHTYYLNVSVGTVMTPWFSYNYVTQSFTDFWSSMYYEPTSTPPRNSYTSNTYAFSPSLSQAIAIWDGDGVDWSNTVLNTNSTQIPTNQLSVIGAFKAGYYPATNSWAETMSFANDPRLYNSYCQITYIWGQ
jgi:hypothetical protein